MTVIVVMMIVAVMTRIMVVARVGGPVMLIGNGMGVPIRMHPFPIMKTRHTEGLTTNPDMVWSQIVILTAGDADIFVTVPDVIIRIHLHRDRRRRRFHSDAAIGTYRATGKPSRDRETGQPRQQRDGFDPFHVF